jgi:cysteine desulfurase
MSKKNIYLDYAGATPLDRKVIRKMALYERVFFANPSAIHSQGMKVRAIIEEARNKIAKLINAHSDEVVFTSSGTESDALAIMGVVRGWNMKNKGKVPHIITSKIEHSAVLENYRLLEKTEEAEVTYISVDKMGIVDLEEFKDSLKENTILVSIMYANNEIGTIEPVEEIAKIIRHFNKDNENKILFHTDACQAMNYLYTDNIEKLGVDMMTFNSSKIYGPKGIGILYKKRNIDLCPLYMGGGQEFGLHSGTESVSLIAGVATALEITNKIKQKESIRLIKIRNYGIDKLLSLSSISGYKIILNGNKENRLPNNINISILGISSELLVIELSARGIFVSEKSACKSDDENTSYVIEAIRKVCHRNSNKEDGSLRISLGRYTKKGDMDCLVKALKNILEKYKHWH